MGLSVRARVVAAVLVGTGTLTVGVRPAMAATGACCSGMADVMQAELPGLEYTYGGLTFPPFRSTRFDFGVTFTAVHSAWLELEGYTDMSGSTLHLTAGLDGVDSPVVDLPVDGPGLFPPFEVTLPLVVGPGVLDGEGMVSLHLTTTGSGADLSSTVLEATLYLDVEECTYVTEDECISAGGDYQGDGITCESDPCPDGPGACCFCEAACQDLNAADCDAADGIFKGQGTTCLSNSCPVPTDDIECPMELTCNTAVVVDNTTFTTTTDEPLFSCGTWGPTSGAGSAWLTFVATDTTARVSTCDSEVNDTLLAVYDGVLGSLTEIGCSEDACGLSGHLSELCVGGLVIGQTYYVKVAGLTVSDLGRTTVGLECPCPAAACCLVDGSCSSLNEVACTAAAGDFQGVGSDCAEANCPTICGPGAGDCYTPNASPGCEAVSCCELVCAADPYCCDSDWDQLCAAAADEVCGDPKGACCLPDDDCQEIWVSECAALGGLFRGDASVCVVPAGSPMTLDSTPGVAIPDDDPVGVSDVINVAAAQAIGDVNVNVEIIHSLIRDLIIEIEHGGVTVVLWYGQCSGWADMDVLFDDEGLANNPCADVSLGIVIQQPAERLFLRDFGLTKFDGMDAAGDWTLTVKDGFAGDTGTLVAWSLILDEAVDSGDCDIDLDDFDEFAACVTGPGGTLPGPECEISDTDVDGDVDLEDFGVFQEVFTSG